MKALCWEGVNKLSVEQVPDPALRNDQDVIVRLIAGTTCGSDLQLIGGYIPFMRSGTSSVTSSSARLSRSARRYAATRWGTGWWCARSSGAAAAGTAPTTCGPCATTPTPIPASVRPCSCRHRRHLRLLPRHGRAARQPCRVRARALRRLRGLPRTGGRRRHERPVRVRLGAHGLDGRRSGRGEARRRGRSVGLRGRRPDGGTRRDPVGRGTCDLHRQDPRASGDDRAAHRQRGHRLHEHRRRGGTARAHRRPWPRRVHRGRRHGSPQRQSRAPLRPGQAAAAAADRPSHRRTAGHSRLPQGRYGLRPGRVRRRRRQVPPRRADQQGPDRAGRPAAPATSRCCWTGWRPES